MDTPAPAKPAGLTDEDIRFMIPNLAERSIAAGQKNIFEGAAVRPEMVKKAKQDITSDGWNFRGESDDIFQKNTDQINADAKKNEGLTEGEINRRDLGVDEADVLAGDFSSMYDQFKKLPGKDNQGVDEFKEWLKDNDIPFTDSDFEGWKLAKSHSDYGGTDSAAAARVNTGGIIKGYKRPVKKRRTIIG